MITMNFEIFVTVILSILSTTVVKAYDVCTTVGGFVTYCYGDSYCCHGGRECCSRDVYVYELWWFWFIWILFFISILSCLICLRRRRMQRRYHQIRVAQPVYGTNVTHTAAYPQPNPYQPTPNPSAPAYTPPYNQYPQQKPPPYHQ